MSNGNDSQQDRGKHYFLHPIRPAQRQYEALRAYLVEGVPAKEAAPRFGYSTATLYTLCRELRAGRIDFFPPTAPGPKHAPKRDALRGRVIELRKRNYSVYDIRRILLAEKVSASHVLIHRILQAEGFAKLPRRREDERPVTPRPEPAAVADIRELRWQDFAHFETEGAALFVLLPTIVQWTMDRWVHAAHLPGSQMIPALQSFLSLLALKLTGRERISHVMDVCDDQGFALFAGLNVLPKTYALSTYSYRITRPMTALLLAKYVSALRSHHLGIRREFQSGLPRHPASRPRSRPGETLRFQALSPRTSHSGFPGAGQRHTSSVLRQRGRTSGWSRRGDHPFRRVLERDDRQSPPSFGLRLSVDHSRCPGST